MSKENIIVSVGLEERVEYIDLMLSLDGLEHIKENPLAAYCPISLTQVPRALKEILQKRQDLLMQRVLIPAGITAYDPGSAPYSPDRDKTSNPDKIYVVDSEKIAGARFFVGHNLIGSSGQGVEAEKAKALNRIVVILMDKGIRVSRMQPHRAIYLEYENFEKEHEKFIPVFEMLKQFEPGMGFEEGKPILVGFDAKGDVCNLEKEVYSVFPDLKYKYNGDAPTVKLQVKNPRIFYENK